MARILTGIQSTGVPHLGNLLGAIIPAIELSKENEALLFIADLHSLTSIKDAELRRNNVDTVAAAWIAMGFDYKTNLMYRQSDLPEVCELTWYLNCFTPYPMLKNAHSFKDKSDRLAVVNAGLFTYPVLMAADILLYDADIVPIGKDQIQHLEICRDIAKSINHLYGTDLFVVPEAKTDISVMTVPGTDGQKMSKSYGNFINIFEDAKSIKKQVATIVTDATTLEEPKNPENSTVYAIYKLVATESKAAEMAEKYLAGGYGHGHAKAELTAILVDLFDKQRTRYQELVANPKELEHCLSLGAEKARKIVNVTLARVRNVLGVGPRV